MPTRLKRLISPTDAEAQKLGKLTEALIAGLDSDIRPQVVARSGDTADVAEDKWKRAVTEGLATVQGRASSGGLQYIHHQDAPSATWNIPHNMGGYPAVAVVDSANRVGFGHVTYIDVNSLRVDFSAGFSGRAYLVL